MQQGRLIRHEAREHRPGVLMRQRPRPFKAVRLGLRPRDAVIGRRQRAAIGRDMKRVPAGEQHGQLHPRHARPMAYIAGVHMNEGIAGGIIAHAAALMHQPGIANLFERHIGEDNIGSLSGDMAAIARLAAGGPPQHLVGGARAIAANQVDGLFGANVVVHLPNEVDERGVHLDFLVPPPVPHEVIERLQRLGDEFAIPLEGDVNRFLRVNVEHGNRAIFRARRIGHGDEKRTYCKQKPEPPQARDHATLYQLHRYAL